MHFSAGKLQIYDAVNMSHGVIRTANSFPYTAKSMFVGVINNKSQQTNQTLKNK